MRYDDICGNNMNCFVNFTVEHNFTGKIGLYYKITNFKQNRREIAESYSTDMLMGKVAKNLDSCKFRKYQNDTQDIRNLYVPCGLLPQYVFNDTFFIIEMNKFRDTEITLNTDRKTMFKMPAQEYSSSMHWLNDNDLFNGEQTNQHFIVWMRQSAFSPFRKLYATSDSLPSGNYTMYIQNNYNITAFGGKKYFVLTEIGNFGARRYAPACIFGILGCVFALISGFLGLMAWNRMKPNSIYHPKKLHEFIVNKGKI